MTWPEDTLLGGRGESDAYRTWKPGNIPSDYTYREISSNMVDIELIYIDTVNRIELPTYITYLDSHVIMVEVGRNSKIISDTRRTLELIPFTLNYESMHQVPIAYATIRHDDDHARESDMIKVRDSLSVPVMDNN